MLFDSLKERAGGPTKLMPMEIAHHTLFTAREKLELLQQLMAEVSGEAANRDKLGFSPEEVEAAIAEVRAGAQDNVAANTVLRGDF
jgi:hypothetical protein